LGEEGVVLLQQRGREEEERSGIINSWVLRSHIGADAPRSKQQDPSSGTLETMLALFEHINARIKLRLEAGEREVGVYSTVTMQRLESPEHRDRSTPHIACLSDHPAHIGRLRVRLALETRKD